MTKPSSVSGQRFTGAKVTQGHRARNQRIDGPTRTGRPGLRQRRCYPEWPPSTRSTVHPCFRSGRSRSRRCSLQPSAKRVVEIGALRGETHAADPRVPRARRPSSTSSIRCRRSTPPSTSSRFAGPVPFHRDLSHNVLAHLAADGRRPHRRRPQLVHRLPRAADAGATSPAAPARPSRARSCTTCGWPYGRRDLYYAPGQIPEELRQPWRPAGHAARARASCSTAAASTPPCATPSDEGGPRNGVMTGARRLHRRARPPLRLVVAPDLLRAGDRGRARSGSSAHPELAAVLDRLEGVEGQRGLLALAEDVRLRAMLLPAQRRLPALERGSSRRRSAVPRRPEGRPARRALPRERGAPRLPRPELRPRAGPEPDRLRDPVRARPGRLTGGCCASGPAPAGPRTRRTPSFLPYTAMGRTRLDHLQGCLDTGPNASRCRATSSRSAPARRRGHLHARLPRVHERDRPEGLGRRPVPCRPRTGPPADVPPSGVAGLQADLNLVRDGVRPVRPARRPGPVPAGPSGDTLADAPVERIALLRLGPGLGADADAVLERSTTGRPSAGSSSSTTHAESGLSRSAVERVP